MEERRRFYRRDDICKGCDNLHHYIGQPENEHCGINECFFVVPSNCLRLMEYLVLSQGEEGKKDEVS